MNKKIVLLVCMLVLSVALLSGCVSTGVTEYKGKIKMIDYPPFKVNEKYEFIYVGYNGVEKILKLDDFYEKDDFNRFIYAMNNNCTLHFTFIWWFGSKQLVVKDIYNCGGQENL